MPGRNAQRPTGDTDIQTILTTNPVRQGPANAICNVAKRERSSQCITLLLSVLHIFWEIVDSLDDTEASDDHRMFYVHFKAYNLLLTECISPIQHVASTAELESLARLILNKLTSFLPSPVIPDYETAVAVSNPFPRLTTLEYYWELSEPRDQKLLHARQCLDFGSQERQDEMIVLLRACVATLRSQCPEDTVDRGEEYRAPRKKRKPTSSAWSAANIVFQALAASSKECSSVHSHEYAVTLRLMTHRKHVEDQYAFEAFVMLNLTRRLWQETQIQSIQSSSAPEERSGVTFAMPQDQKRQRVRRRLHVKRLCEHIEKTQSMPSMRLNLAVENGRLWKDQSSKSELPISRSDLPLSLEDIIKSRPASLTEKIKRVLAVLLAYSVLHLRQTPWLQPSCFNAANILFFSTATTTPLKPYIHTELNKVEHNAAEDIGDIDTEIDPDDEPSHPYPDIIMLAIMLMELYMIQPIQSLAEKAEMELDDWDNIDDNTRYAIAVAVFERFKAEFPDNYRKAVDKCLDPNIGLDQNDKELDEEGLKCLIYEEIVQPLEDELDQGFGNTIPIDSIDEVAQTLDLRSWGQVRLNQQPSSPPESVENIQPFHDLPKGLSGTFISLPDTRVFSQSNEPSKDRGYSPLPNIHRSLSDPYSLSALSHQNYTVGWICALPKEMAAAQAMLDEIHRPLPQDASDRNNYTLGRMGAHNVVMACLPAGVMGTVSAARVANHMLSTFKWLRFGLMVGIGGGVPGVKDVRLGDVVVGAPSGSFGGVIQYDFGKTMQDCKFLRTGTLNRPPDILLTAVSRLQADHYRNRPKLENYLKEIVTQYPLLSTEFSHPGVEHDLLYHCEYDHPLDKESCEQCDLARLIQRIPRGSHLPYIHYGLIASGNQVMRNGVARDRLRKDLDVLCFEMEAAGLVDDFPCLVIRGICDYSDSHKNKKWQGYAAATAAAYAKELLSVISGNQIEDAKRLVHY